MKTPITHLIERLEAMQAAAPFIERNVYTKAIREAKEMLKDEKEAIMNAWNNAWLDWDDISSVRDYFDITYPQPTKTDSTDND